MISHVAGPSTPSICPVGAYHLLFNVAGPHSKARGATKSEYDEGRQNENSNTNILV